MAERKVINRYYPPDFDPDKIPLGRQGGGGQHKVRLMAPFSMRCNTCGNYIYKGTKFNARKEIVWGEDYLGITTYRFYIRCPMCASELTFKTDPKNSDYVSEHGMTRNFEAWREEKIANEEFSYRRKKEEELDPMKALENITTDSKVSIEILEMLDEVRTKNARFEKIDADMALGVIAEKEAKERAAVKAQQEQQEDEDTRLAQLAFMSAKPPPYQSALNNNPKRKTAEVTQPQQPQQKKLKKSDFIQTVSTVSTFTATSSKIMKQDEPQKSKDLKHPQPKSKQPEKAKKLLVVDYNSDDSDD